MFNHQDFLNLPGQEKIIKIAIADDHKIFRKGVILGLRKYTNLKFVLEADNGQALIDQLPESDPDVILMDLKMPVKDGIETTKYVNQHFPSIKILIFTMYEDERFVVQLMESGANGYLLKSTDTAEINKAISDLMRKGFYLSNFVNKILISKNYSKLRSNSNMDIEAGTIEQEKENLKLFCQEYIVKQISQIISATIDSIKAIIDRLMGKK